MDAKWGLIRCSAVVVAFGLSGWAQAADGLSVPASPSAGARWQPRLELTDVAGVRLGSSGATDAAGWVRAALLGDYDLGDFGWSLPHTSGRFRATSGLMFGLRGFGGISAGGLAGVNPDTATVSSPYVGLGYTGWLTKTGLSFTADVGLMADYPGGTWRFGRALFGNQGADATLRELRLQPRLQLGVQYSY